MHKRKINIKTESVKVKAGIYLLLLDPNSKIYSGMVWNEEIQPLVENYTIPADTGIQEQPIVNFTIPDGSPPVSVPGIYTFFLAALKPGTFDFLSNVAKTSFTTRYL